MIIALTTEGTMLSSPMDTRFGRTQYFLLYDTETGENTLIDNTSGRDAAHGAGIQAAETLASHNVAALITGNCGPKALRVLAAAGITIYTTDAPTVADAIEQYNAGILTVLHAGTATAQTT